MILLLDAGNTRVKWAWLEDRDVEAAGAVAHDATHRSWQREIASDSPRPARIVVANVAGPSFAAAMTLWARDHYGLAPEFVTATTQQFGVTNGYQRPSALGVDRWLGMLAAWHAVQTPTLVVNSGTAVTMDALDATGHHQGGLILPGIQMLSDVRQTLIDPTGTPSGPDTSTSPSIPWAFAATAERACSELAARVGGKPRLVLTGGGAPYLATHLRRSAEVVTDLVLSGLALVALQAPPQADASAVTDPASLARDT